MEMMNSRAWGGEILLLELFLFDVCVISPPPPGAEHASITVRTHIQVAQSQVDEAQKLSLDAEKKLAETKVMEVERMAQHAVSSQSHNDEDEVPDAYLREDWRLSVHSHSTALGSVSCFVSLMDNWK